MDRTDSAGGDLMIFNESGVYPGISGQFAGCHVTVNEDGALDIQPLAHHPDPGYEAPDTPIETTEAPAPDTIEGE